MTAAALVRFAASLFTLAALLWAVDSSLHLFNHPTFRGEAALALVACAVLAVLIVWTATAMLRWTRAALR
jgi:hypothetical protein